MGPWSLSRRAVNSYGAAMASATLERTEPVHEPERRSPHWRDGLLLSVIGFVLAFHIVLLAALVVVSLAGGGESAEEDELVVAARTNVVAGEFFFTVDQHPSGSPIEMTLDNQGAIFHNLLIEGAPGFVLEADASMADVGVVELADGTWVMYCDVPGHREAGMEAELIVGG